MAMDLAKRRRGTQRGDIREDGFVAATNAIRGPTLPLPRRVTPSGSFTHPEYAEVGLTEAKARETHDVVTTSCRSSLRCGRSSKDARSASASWSWTAGAVASWDATSWASGPGDCAACSGRDRRRHAGRRPGARRGVLPDVCRGSFHAAVLAAIELNLPLSGQAERVRRDCSRRDERSASRSPLPRSPNCDRKPTLR